MCKASCSKIIEALYFKRGLGITGAPLPGLPEIRTAAAQARGTAGLARASPVPASRPGWWGRRGRGFTVLPGAGCWWVHGCSPLGTWPLAWLSRVRLPQSLSFPRADRLRVV